MVCYSVAAALTLESPLNTAHYPALTSQTIAMLAKLKQFDNFST